MHVQHTGTGTLRVLSLSHRHSDPIPISRMFIWYTRFDSRADWPCGPHVSCTSGPLQYRPLSWSSAASIKLYDAGSSAQPLSVPLRSLGFYLHSVIFRCSRPCSRTELSPGTVLFIEVDSENTSLGAGTLGEGNGGLGSIVWAIRGSSLHHCIDLSAECHSPALVLCPYCRAREGWFSMPWKRWAPVNFTDRIGKCFTSLRRSSSSLGRAKGLNAPVADRSHH